MFSWLGITKWAGFGTLAMAFIIGCSAFGVWLRDDAVAVCNAGWELKLGAAAQKAALQEKLLNEKLGDAALKIQAAENKASTTELLASQTLEKQRELSPLPNACDLCRVPNDHLWVREPAGNAAKSSAASSSTADAGRASSAVSKGGR